jgi:opacity protein-like surface antigen
MKIAHVLTSLTLFAACAGPALAQDEAAPEAPGAPSAEQADDEEDEGLVIQLQLYAFIPARTQGTLGVGPAAVDVNVSFEDLWRNTDVGGIAGRIELWTPLRLGFVMDGYFSRVEFEEDRSTPINVGPMSGALASSVSTELRLGIVDLLVGVRAVDTKVAGLARIWVDGLVGGRIMDLKETFDLAVNQQFIELGDSHNWVELAVGARLGVKVGPVAVVARADLSGFGIGSASDLTWNLYGYVRFQPGEMLALDLGYRALDIDYSRGSGADAVALDTTMHGPVLAISLFF